MTIEWLIGILFEVIIINKKTTPNLVSSKIQQMLKYNNSLMDYKKIFISKIFNSEHYILPYSTFL